MILITNVNSRMLVNSWNPVPWCLWQMHAIACHKTPLVSRILRGVEDECFCSHTGVQTGWGKEQTTDMTEDVKTYLLEPLWSWQAAMNSVLVCCLNITSFPLQIGIKIKHWFKAVTCFVVMRSVFSVDAALQFHGSCLGREGRFCAVLREK